MDCLFSIIIPVYNVEKYFAACMDSILSQQEGETEILLIDDGSTDGSGGLCDGYAKEYEFVSVVHKENEGQSRARNVGVEMARGRYVMFVDSDDTIGPCTLKRLALEAERWQYPDMILSDGMYEMDDDGNLTVERHYWKCSEFQGVSGREALERSLKEAPNWSPCGKCYRLDFWRNHGFQFVEHRISEDFQLIDRIVMEAASVIMVPAFYYYRSARQGSTMHSNYDKLVSDTLLSICDWDRYLTDREMSSELRSAFRRVHAKILAHDVLAGIFFTSKPTRRKLLNNVKPYLYLLSYDSSFETKCVKTAVKVIGLRPVCYFLNRLKKHRIGWKKDTGVLRKARRRLRLSAGAQLLRNKRITIISNNCLAGFLYHDYHMRFASPTINLQMLPADFIKFCDHIHDYLAQEVTELTVIPEDVQAAFSGIGGGTIDFPVGRLGDILLFFQHYPSFESAKEKWNERTERINWECVYMVMVDVYCTDAQVEKFLRGSGKRTVLTKKTERTRQGAFLMQGLQECGAAWYAEMPRSRSGKKYYEQFPFVRWFLRGKVE